MLDSGTPYWLSVQAVREFQPQWFWALADSTSGDAVYWAGTSRSRGKPAAGKAAGLSISHTTKD